MIDLKSFALAGVVLAGTAAPALAQQQVTFGYLSLANDVRYHPQVAYTRIQISPEINPVEGARLGVADMKIITDAAGLSVKMDEQQAADADDAIGKVKAMAAAGERFAILDLPGDIVAQLAPAVKDQKITLLNASAPQDSLRDLCLPTLLHTDASDRMLADSLTQFLRHRNLTRVLMLVGQEPRDKEMADAFQASADRLRIGIADCRTFTMATDPAHREQNNTSLVTGGTDYDIVYIADSLGEYSRYLPYATQLPRPVIGSSGLIASEWHWSWDRDGATQVTLRFQRAAAGGREMTGVDWSTWIAAKAILTAYAKARSPDPDKVDEYLKSSRLTLDGSKGYRLNFRPWDRQLRMTTVLATSNAVIDAAPFPEFLHEDNRLDTIGTDAPESKCKP